MYHKIIFVGRLGRDPEMRYTADGTPVTNINVAVDEGFGENKRTIWFHVSTWRKTAEAVAEYLRKGRLVLVEGVLNPGDKGAPKIWTDRDGNPRASYDVTGLRVVFLGGRSDSEGSSGRSDTAGAGKSDRADYEEPWVDEPDPEDDEWDAAPW